MEWLDDYFNPEQFDLTEVNADLQFPDYGLPVWHNINFNFRKLIWHSLSAELM